MSRVALAKEHVEQPRLDHRLAVLERVAATRPWLGVVATDAQLLADIGQGYDVLVLGADKWVQIQDPAFYGGSEAARDAALARLPELAIVARPPHQLPGVEVPGVEVLDVLDVMAIGDGADLGVVSSTAVRAGERQWMVPEALEFDTETGAWTDPARYIRWCEEVAAGQG